MKKRILPLVMALLLIMLPLATVSYSEDEAPEQRLKNVIFMIGDGMGQNQVLMAAEKAGRTLAMQTMPYQGVQSTLNSEGKITDSAAGGTALACGIKTTNGSIGKDPDGKSVMNLREYFVSLGKKTGVVSTTYIFDATPAAFSAHSKDRFDATQVVHQMIAGGNLDVILGGGSGFLDDDLEKTATYDRGYTYVKTRDELETADASRLLGLFSQNALNYAGELKENEPTLAEMTAKAISVLEKGENGFFLMVEGAKIDSAGHLLSDAPEDKVGLNIGEVLSFDDAVKVALDYAKLQGDTLVIVTADHETGNLIRKADGSFEFTDNQHSAQDVPYFAFGPGSEQFQGDLANTDFFHKIRAIADPASATGTTIYFKNELGWETVNSYISDSSWKSAVAWPGTKMKPVAGYDGWFFVTTEEEIDMNIIFNDGNGVQTANHEPSGLSFKTGGAYYFIPSSETESTAGGHKTGHKLTIYEAPESAWPGYIEMPEEIEIPDKNEGNKVNPIKPVSGVNTTDTELSSNTLMILVVLSLALSLVSCVFSFMSFSISNRRPDNSSENK